MKTSQQQYEVLLTYMEQHGDLSKPSTNARGRVSSIRRWEELTTYLNSDGSGDSKSTEKWKKVWSDFKNNTKKKAARLNQAARCTGGGRAVFTKLSDLEQRVLNIIGVQAATGLPVDEVGLSQQQEPALEPSTANSSVSSPMIVIEVREDSQPQPGPSNQPDRSFAVSSPLVQVEILEDADNERVAALNPAQARVAATPSPLQPALSGRTPTMTPRTPNITPRPNRTTRGSPRRIGRPRPYARTTQTEQAASHFLNADNQWREFKIQQHRDQIRIREMEVEIQQGWQNIGNRVLDLLDKVVTKFCEN